MKFDLRIKRAYEAAAKEDGVRILVDRLWPRGVTKEKLAVDEWLREAAPSATLRKWFGHEPSRWHEFLSRYSRELDAKPEVIKRLRGLLASRRVTLVYGARNPDMNQAVALRHYLEQDKGSKKR